MIQQYHISFDNSLIENIYKLKETDRGVKNSNVGGWHSKSFYDSPQWFLSYYNTVCSIVKKDIHNFWFNINGPNHSNKWHTHGNNYSLIGVWYLSIPKNSGNFQIEINDKLETIEPYTELFITHSCGLNHCVTENLSDQNRISVAFNFI